jgi:hypothetical protein
MGEAQAVLGDYNQDGCLDIFMAGTQRNSLWENDGKGHFTSVMGHSGSMSYKCPGGTSETRAVDLNHDGRDDLCMMYPRTGVVYHFNRGFRCFGEEGEVRLGGLQAEAGQPGKGVLAMAVADFNEDNSQDLAILISDGEMACYTNGQYDMPGIRLRLPKGKTGPVTVSCWQDDKLPVCVGTEAVTGHSPAAFVATRSSGDVTLKWHVPGKGLVTKKVTVEGTYTDAVVGAAEAKTAKK